MAALLNSSSVLMCPHGGTVQAITSNTRVKAAGDFLLRSSDTFTIAACPFVLGTSPGERADLPEFGCGLRQLLFAPNSDALQATTRLIVQKSLDRWLGDQIEVKNVLVSSGPGGDDSQILVQIEYLLIETRSKQT